MHQITAIVSLVLIAILFEVSFFVEIPDTNHAPEIYNIAPLDIQQVRLPFIENQGQIPSESIKYYAKTFAGTVYVMDSDLTYYSIKKENNSTTALVIKERFLGDRLQPKGIEKSQAVANYFKGSQENWKTNIPTFDGVALGTVWPNIDVQLHAYGNNVEKIFTVSPGGKPSDIRINFEGISGLSISESNNLVVNTELGSIALSKPIAYQNIDGRRHDVLASYNIIDSDTYGFSVLSYDPRFDLVIDPLIASTFIGGSGEDSGNDVAVDSSGNVYVTGYTTDAATDLPTTAGAYDTTNNGFMDAFVSKFNNNLTTLSASTFIGGTNSDVGLGITLDSSGNVYIVGYTVDGVTDYPTTGGAYDTTHNGTYDVFVSKLNSALSALSASTFIGGGGNDYGYAIFVDSNSTNVYITGETAADASSFPTTAGAYNTTHNSAAGVMDAFVSKFNNNLTTLSASTFIGGSGSDVGNSIAVDSLGNAYITGSTPSAVTNYPTTAGAYDTVHNGALDTFVSKLNSTLGALQGSTFIGGSMDDVGYEIILDSSNNIYVVGYTADAPTDFPTTGGAYDTTHNGSNDAFVSKFNNNLTTLSASTLIGGSGDDSGHSITLDSSNNIYLVGLTHDAATDLPTTTNAYDVTHNGGDDAFVSKFNNNLTTLSASTFIGGNDDENGLGIALDSSSNVYISGRTFDGTTDFPTSSNAYDTTHNGDYDGFVAIFDSSLSASGSSSISSGGSTSVTVGAGGTASVDLPSGNDLSVTLPAGTAGTVTVSDSNAGQSDANLGFLGTVTDIEVSGNGCSGGCTISFTFTGAQASAQGINPSNVAIYHDSNENGNFESSERLTTTIVGNDPYTATATASFTSKFAVGGVKALAVAGISQAASLGFFDLDKCNPDGFESGVSLRVYEIEYDKCELNKIKILAHSTCGPISAQIVSKYGTSMAGISSDQPFLEEKKQIYSANLDPELDSVNIVIKDKRDAFSKQINLNQCTGKISYTGMTGYTSAQQTSVIEPEGTENITEQATVQQIPSWVKSNAGWWASGQIGDTEFTQGIEYLIKNNVITVPDSVKTESAEAKEIPNWIKTNSQWWSEGKISDSEFARGLEYLIKMGVIRI